MHHILLPLVGMVFLASGGLALVYEVVWARLFAVEMGSDTVANSIVVTLFMGGLAAGATIVGRFVDKVARPLRLYGLLEILLGTYVLVSPDVFRSILPFFHLIGMSNVDNNTVVNMARLLCAGGLLLIPTLMMGAGLPLLARFSALYARNPSDTIATFYAINILGAIFGCLLAGFHFLPVFGVQDTLFYGGILNILIGAAAIGLSFSVGSGTALRPHSMHAPAAFRGAGAHVGIVAAVALTGFASLVCQLAWTRVFVLIVGASAYAFTTVVAVFLAGLGLGALLASLIIRHASVRPGKLFSFLALLASFAIFLTTFLFSHLPDFFVTHVDTHAVATRQGTLRLQVLVSSIVMLWPALLMGMLFPVALKLVLDDRAVAGRTTALLYTWNTLGSIVGSFSAVFFLVPVLGIQNTLLLSASIFLLAAVAPLVPGVSVIALSPHFFTAFALMAGFWIFSPPWDQKLMVSGVSEYLYKYRHSRADSVSEKVDQEVDLLFYQDGLTATISVTQDLVSPHRDLYISTNGKIDGSSRFDMPTQKLIAHLPLILHPQPERIAVIGLGTGVTAGSAVLHERVSHVDIIEIESAVIDASRLFSDFNHNVHDSAKVSFHLTDGRLHLFLNPGLYDVILSEPSNPWIAGIATLFTEEFYCVGARSLKDGGIFAQWLQMYDMKPDNVLSIFRTFQKVFPYTYVAVTLANADLLLIGSRDALTFDLARLDGVFQQDSVYADLRDDNVRVNSIHDLLARIWLLPEDVSRLSSGARLHKDDLPFLAYEAPLSRYMDTREDNMAIMAGAASGVVGLPEFRENEAFGEEMRRAYARHLPFRSLVPTTMHNK